MASTKQVRRSVTLPSRLAEQVGRLAKKKRVSDNRMLVELLEQGLDAQRQKEKTVFELAERFHAASDPKQVKQLGDEMGRFIFGINAAIERWSRMPAAVRDHLIERMKDRNISVADLNRLPGWLETKPGVPEGPWYKDFGSFKLRGGGPLPTTFQISGQAASGEKL
jgi:hypothetical protein